jgi:transcription elongation factor GreA-like protein
MGMIHRQKPHVVLEKIIAGATPNHFMFHLHFHTFHTHRNSQTWSVGSVLNVENKNLVDPAPPLRTTLKWPTAKASDIITGHRTITHTNSAQFTRKQCFSAHIAR